MGQSDRHIFALLNWILSLGGQFPPQFSCKKRFPDLLSSKSPSFPHAFSGNPGEARTGPPIEAFGGDALPINSHRSFLNTRQLSATIVPANQISCTRRFL